MTQTNTTEELTTLADMTSANTGVAMPLDAEEYAEDQSAELDEADDGVEALIIHMDRTTAEHLFLRAQRRLG